jgi:hypothetical protein
MPFVTFKLELSKKAQRPNHRAVRSFYHRIPQPAINDRLSSPHTVMQQREQQLQDFSLSGDMRSFESSQLEIMLLALGILFLVVILGTIVSIGVRNGQRTLRAIRDCRDQGYQNASAWGFARGDGDEFQSPPHWDSECFVDGLRKRSASLTGSTNKKLMLMERRHTLTGSPDDLRSTNTRGTFRHFREDGGRREL